MWCPVVNHTLHFGSCTLEKIMILLTNFYQGISCRFGESWSPIYLELRYLRTIKYYVLH